MSRKKKKIIYGDAKYEGYIRYLIEFVSGENEWKEERLVVVEKKDELFFDIYLNIIKSIISSAGMNLENIRKLDFRLFDKYFIVHDGFWGHWIYPEDIYSRDQPMLIDGWIKIKDGATKEEE
jgi:hypothetical protein